MAPKITKDMTFQQVIQLNPEVGKVFDKYNLGCVGCLGASTESLAQGIRAHGLNLDDVLADLNALLEDS
ncbi:DUF1858 domain-containing protein [Pelobacter seleniigenes]|uniref:DUF1858 domain-containing protein n=1 Tax=Pelobacter seleniigenes TaxID=407188 RepID=UPI0009FCD5B4|nr:DUF1858 domain-containing protein [Pelobacter seleniigenes]